MSEQPPLTSTTPTPLSPRSQQRRLVSVLAALLLLVSGGVIGGVVGAMVVRNQVIKTIRNPQGPMIDMSDRMRARLNLTDEQHDQIKQILDQHHSIILQHRQAIFENIQMIQQEVEEVLTPEQVTMWKRRIDALDRRGGMGFQRFGRHRPPHHPPGVRGPLADVESLFERSDRDRDGKLTFEEFSVGNAERGPRMFPRLDADGDGYLTREEIESFRQEFPRGPRRRGMGSSNGGSPDLWRPPPGHDTPRRRPIENYDGQ